MDGEGTGDQNSEVAPGRHRKHDIMDTDDEEDEEECRLCRGPAEEG